MHNHCKYITKGDNAKSKKGRVVIFVRDTLSRPVLHFDQVPSKYSEGYSSYRADTKSISNKTKENNFKSKKTRVVILICDTSSHPVLHFYQVSSKYSKEYSSYRVDTKSISDKTKGDNSKSKKARFVILVQDMSRAVLPIIKIFQRLFDLHSGHEINA